MATKQPDDATYALAVERVIWYGLWWTIQSSVFLLTWMYYSFSDDYRDARAAFGMFLPFARGAAGCLNFNGGIALLLVSRQFLSLLRETCLSRIVSIDKHIHAHKV